MKNVYFKLAVWLFFLINLGLSSEAKEIPGTPVAPTYCEVSSYTGCGTRNADRVETMEIKQGTTVIFSNVSSGTGVSCRSDVGIAGYSDFTSTVITLEKGATYTFIFKRDVDQYYSNNKIALWIDLNNDYNLDDFDEMFRANSVDSHSPYYSVDVTIPMTATEATTRLRIRVIESESDIEACGGGYETEDYSVAITPPLSTISLNVATPDRACEGGVLNVFYNTTGTFNGGNVFTAQLSDAAGKFISLVAVATGASPIAMQIPSGVFGNGYKIRVISSTPSVMSNEVSVTINPLPLPPSSGSLIPSERCQFLSPVPMSSSLTCLPGQTIIWYENERGGAPLTRLPTQTPNENKSYYASCRDNLTGCESASRYKTSFKIVTVEKPQNVYLVADGVKVVEGKSETICNVQGEDMLFSTSCATGETQLISVDGLDFALINPQQVVDGRVHTYRIRCQLGSGVDACIGPESGPMSVRIIPTVLAPKVSISPETVCAGSPSQVFTGSTNCGTATTLWFDALTNSPMASLPSMTPTSTQSYYAKCKGEADCLSNPSEIVTFNVIPSNVIPIIYSNHSDENCIGTEVKLTTNCPVGSTVVWNNVYKNPELVLSWLTPHTEMISAKCEFTGGCTTPNAAKKLVWKIIDVTIINIGTSQVGQKPGTNVPLDAWNSQFVTMDAGPSLEESTETNPTIFYVENPNKSAPRFWTVHVDACKQPIGGSMSYDLLCRPETGPSKSFNTHENTPPYLMFANGDNFTQLYTINHPFYGFYTQGANGENIYDQGFPKGLYKMGIRYWDQKGVGEAPAVRRAIGNVLLYKEYWFRIVSKSGIASGPTRQSYEIADEKGYFVAPNPVSNYTILTIKNAKGEKLSWKLIDQLGRVIQSKEIIPDSNQYQERINMSTENVGLYFVQLEGGNFNKMIKVLKTNLD